MFARAAFYFGLAAHSLAKSDLLTLLCVGYSESHQLENSIAQSLGQRDERDLQMTHARSSIYRFQTNERSFGPCDTQNTRRRRKAARRVNDSHADCAQCEPRILNCRLRWDGASEKHLLSLGYILVQTTTRAWHFFISLLDRLCDCRDVPVANVVFYLASKWKRCCDLDLIKADVPRRHSGSLLSIALVNR